MVKMVMRSDLAGIYTTKELKGSGIGLWLTSEVITRHNGRIRLRSRTAGRYRGTIFDIFLPEFTTAAASVEPLVIEASAAAGV